MRSWRRDKKSSPYRNSALSIEKLEARELLSVNSIAIQSGHTARFVDSDGTRVGVQLIGPGSGTIELTNGQLTGGDIDNLTLHGTTSRSKLKITTNGGSIGGTTINELMIEKALNQLGALNHLLATNLDFVAGGHLTADGDITDIAIRSLGAGAEFDIAGDVERLKSESILDDASVDISGRLQNFIADTVSDGAKVSADKLGLLNVRDAHGATFDIGAGGIQVTKINNIRNSIISSQGNIDEILIRGNMIATSLACNISAGSDGIYGTIDDWVTDPTAAGTIKSLKVNGKLGSTPAEQVKLVASGTVDTMNLGARNSDAQPLVWEQAASQNIPLDVVSTAINAHGFSDAEIWVALFGQDIPIPPPGQSLTGTSYFLDPTTISNGVAHRTATSSLPVSASTPDLAILPSANLTTWADSLNLHVPAPGRQFTGRILISAGVPVQAQVNADGSVSSPSPANPADPSTGTFYDFLEFTVTNNGGVPNLDIDTTQVDAFGMPIGLQFFTDTSGTPFTVPISGTATASSAVISGVNTTGISVGQPIFGGALPAGGARIISLVPSTGGSANGSIQLSQIYPTPGPVSLTVYPAGPVGVIAPRDAILSGNTNESLLTFISAKVAQGNEQARPFLQTAAPYPTFAPVPITGATTDAGSIVITTDSTAGLQSGYQISISGITGYVGANGNQSVGTVLSATQFTLAGPAGSGTYNAGGTWSMLITGADYDPQHPDDEILIHAWSTEGLQNGDLVEISGVQGNTAANGFFYVSDVQARSFKLVDSKGNAAFIIGGGIFKIYSQAERVVAPKDIVEALPSPFDSNGLNSYFNKAIDNFFWHYYPAGGNNTLQLYSDVTEITYQGTVTNQSTANGGFVLRMTGGGSSYDILYPFFSTNTPSDYTPAFGAAAPPSWIKNGQQLESPSEMVFACDTVFADNISRGLSGIPSSIVGDLENSISAAFNRGIAMNPADTWGNANTWYPDGGTYNYWVEFWHQTGLTQSNLAYAFPYDDKFGTSTNLNENNVGQVQITLGSWSDMATGTTTSFVNPPSSGTLQGPISLTAKVVDAISQPVTTGSVTFYVNGTAINSNDSSSSPPMQPIALNGSGEATINAIVPALPDGTTPHTYTVTAVYSGDGANNLPSVAYQPLQFTPPMELALSTNNVPLGTQVTMDVTLGTASFAGSVDFSISRGDGTGVKDFTPHVTPSSNMVSGTYTLPLDLLTFTGDVGATLGTNYINNVSNFVDLRNGQALTGTGLQSGTTISSFTKHQLTLSQPASFSGPVSLTVNGRTFSAVISNTVLTNVNGIDVISDLQDGDTITGSGIPAGTTIQTLIPGNIQLSKSATASGTVTYTSNGAGASFPITAKFTPTVGQSASVTVDIGIVA